MQRTNGDTLWIESKKQETTVDKIVFLNEVEENNAIHIKNFQD